MGIRFWPSRACGGVVALLVLAAPSGCTRQQDTPHQPTETAPATATAPPATPDTAGPSATEVPNADTPSPYDALPEAVRVLADKPFTGDFDEMVKRRIDSCGRDVQPNALLHRQGAAARPHVRGAEIIRERPQRRLEDRQPQGARGDRADVARSAVSGALRPARSTWSRPWSPSRPELEKLVAFSEPTRTNVSEVVVTGPGAPPICDGRRSGRSGGVRPQGERLLRDPHRLNEQLKARGKPPVVIDAGPGRPRRR